MELSNILMMSIGLSMFTYGFASNIKIYYRSYLLYRDANIKQARIAKNKIIGTIIILIVGWSSIMALFAIKVMG